MKNELEDVAVHDIISRRNTSQFEVYVRFICQVEVIVITFLDYKKESC